MAPKSLAAQRVR